MKKEIYNIVVADSKGKFYADAREGYVDAREIDGIEVRFGIRKDGKRWTLDDVNTGTSYTSDKFATLKAATSFFDTNVVDKFHSYLKEKPERYEAHKRMAASIAETGEHVEKKEYERRVRQLASSIKQEVARASCEPKDESCDVATKVSVETMREWAKGKDGLRIEQAGKSADNPIWVCGPSKPYRDELMAMGFKWGHSRKFGKGWHFDPVRQ